MRIVVIYKYFPLQYIMNLTTHILETELLYCTVCIKDTSSCEV